MGFKFIKTIDTENKFDTTNVTVELPHNEQTLPELLEAFQDFLKGCAFHFEGNVEIVNDEDNNEI